MADATEIPDARFGEAPLLNAGSIRWRQTAGTAPSQALLPTTPGWAEFEFRQSGRRTLLIEDVDGSRHEWLGLEMLRKAPGPNPFIVNIVASDRRWRWEHAHIVRDYNIRRRTGTTRRGDWQELVQQAEQPVFDYREYSLRSDGTVWGAIQVLRDVITTVDPFAQVTIDDDVKDLRQIPIENLIIDDPGPAAVRQALRFIPGAQVTVDPDGGVRVFNTTSGGEIPIVSQLQPFFADEGHVIDVDYSRMRPSAVRVWFTVEAEVRFDSIDLDGTALRPKYARSMDNVIEIPDFRLAVPAAVGAAGATSETQGSFLDIGVYIAAVNDPAVPRPSGTLLKVSTGLLNRILLPGMGPHSATLNAGKQVLNARDANWSARLSRLMRDYRSLYQINRQWIDRVRTLKAELVATINRQTGQRAPSPAFSDYSVIPSQKAILRAAASGGSWFYAYNVDSYPGDGKPLMTLVGSNSANVPAPARVSVVDPDQGVLRVAYQIDPYANQDRVLPGKIDNLPVRTVRPEDVDAGVPTAWNAARADPTKQPQLARNHRLAVVLTATPTSPNSKRRMYSIVVRPGEVRDLLGPDSALAAGLLNTNDTIVQDVRVGASVETARVAWLEERSTDIEALFGITPGGGDTSQTLKRGIKDLVVNDSPQARLGESAASLPAIARAIAATVWAKWRDRLEGEAAVRADRAIPMAGNLAAVTTTLTDGVVKHILGLPTHVADLDLFSYMPPETRAVILKTVRPI